MGAKLHITFFLDENNRYEANCWSCSLLVVIEQNSKDYKKFKRLLKKKKIKYVYNYTARKTLLTVVSTKRVVGYNC